MAPELHCSGGTVVEPNDIHVNERHLDMLLAHITLSDKAFMGSVTHRRNAEDTV
ncbi:MAG: trimethylamine methyltransferase, partial [Caldilineae bacterium]